MSYSDVADLASDPEFNRRLAAGLTSEAMYKAADPLGDLILKGPGYAASLFIPLVSSAPSFGDLYAGGGQEAIFDADLLAAIQAAWPRVTALYSDQLTPPSAG